jgi:ABC-type nitrate/sulfonate/bicarbonate transport system substrate-binding protein
LLAIRIILGVFGDRRRTPLREKVELHGRKEGDDQDRSGATPKPVCRPAAFHYAAGGSSNNKMQMITFGVRGRIAALSAALVAGAANAQQGGALEDVTLAVPNVALTFAAGYVAEDLGLFEKQGLRVKSVVIAGIGATNAVIAGSADFAEISTPTLTRAAARGQRLVAIANTLNRVTVELVLRKELAAGFDPKAPLDKRVQVMRGRTLAVDSINSVIHGYVLLLARRAGIDPNDIRISPMAPPNMMAAYSTRQIDGFAMSMPWPLQPVLEGSATLIASGPDGDPPDMIPFGHNVLVAKPETCAKHKSMCRGMGKAFKEAVTYMHEHPTETLALLKKRFASVGDDLLAAAFKEIIKGTPRPPIVTKADLENGEIYNVEAGLLKPEEKLKSYDGLYTDEYLR